MGTSLTGTKPKDTYDSLIKVTDNGPLSGTAKYLSDGLGNDSALALSTARVGIGTASPASDKILQLNNGSGTFVRMTMTNTATGTAGTDGLSLSVENSKAIIKNQENEDLVLGANNSETQLVLAAGGNVGIGTSSPATKFHVAGADAWMTLQRTSGTTNILDFTDSAAARLGYVGFISSSLTLNTKAGSDIIFAPNNGEAGRFTSNGLTFNGDTAAANALDDYEEGTWTMGVQFGGASVGVVYGANTGTYTKIGRQVTVNGILVISDKGTSTGIAQVTGLPFAINNSISSFPAVTLRTENISNTGTIQAYGNISTTVIPLEQVSTAGTSGAIFNTDFSNNSSVMVTFTYFVS